MILRRFLSVFVAALLVLAACSDGGSGTPSASGSGGAGGIVGGQGGVGGSSNGAGGVAGSSADASAGTGGITSPVDAASAGDAGSGSDTGSAGSMGGGLEPGDTPPWRPLNVTAPPGQHVHGNAGLDNRAKLLGKLAIDLGVNAGGYSAWLGKRGFHVMGASFGECNAPNLGAGRDAVGTCRLGEFKTINMQVAAGLASLQQQFPTEDWGYFLNRDGTVRWSDVAITGMSHGATTAALIGRIGARVYRVVSRAGPRDDTCGNGMCSTPIDLATHPGKPAAPTPVSPPGWTCRP